MDISRFVAVLAAALSLAPAAGAAVLCVAPAQPACFSTISAALAAAADGDAIEVAAGRYVENLVVVRAVTLEGAAGERPVILPAISDPDCGGAGGGTLCAGASTLALVRASGVTLRNLVFDGDNPALHSGVALGGADVDARNGIVTDFDSGTFTDLTVERVEVRNVFRRGIQIVCDSFPARFAFRGDTVANVQGDPGTSVAILATGATGCTGEMIGNSVRDASDALNSNWSHGIVFRGNHVRRSGSGVHTDNAGAYAGSAADVIEGNVVTDCTDGGFGVWSFVSYLGPAFRHNLVSGCPVGMAALGMGGPAGAPVFEGNRVRGPGSAGIYLTSADLFGFGNFAVSAALQGNAVDGFDTGVLVEQAGAYASSASLSGDRLAHNRTGLAVAGGQATGEGLCVRRNATGASVAGGGALDVHGSAIARSGLGVGLVEGAADARQNWWGSPTGPAPAGRGDGVSAGVQVDPFLTRPPPAVCGDDDDR